MTDTERLRRQRKRLERELHRAVRQVRRAKLREPDAQNGQEIVTLSGSGLAPWPATPSWAAGDQGLSDDDVRALLDQVVAVAVKRGILPVGVASGPAEVVRRVALRRLVGPGPPTDRRAATVNDLALMPPLRHPRDPAAQGAGQD